MLNRIEEGQSDFAAMTRIPLYISCRAIGSQPVQHTTREALEPHRYRAAHKYRRITIPASHAEII